MFFKFQNLYKSYIIFIIFIFFILYLFVFNEFYFCGKNINKIVYKFKFFQTNYVVLFYTILFYFILWDDM